MKFPEPNRTKYEIRGTIIGVPLRLQPLFWSSVATLGIRYYADPEGGSLGYFLFWIAAALSCLLLHALGQAVVGRLLGICGEIVLDGLGSQFVGVDRLPRCWQRVLTRLAGSLVQFALVGGIWGLTEIPFPQTLSDWGWKSPIANGAKILLDINLTWGLLTVLPLWPLAGGRVALDVGETLLGRKGRTLALLLSLAVTAILSTWVVFEMSLHLSFPYDPRYLLHLIEGVIRLFFCFILWTISFKAMWPVDSSAHEPVTTD